MERINEKNSFSVEDIHKVREEIYEKTKNLTKDELIEYINSSADVVREEIKKNKRDKIAI